MERGIEMDLIKNLTALQWLGIIILFNSTLLGGASQLADLALSAVAVKAILAAATLGNGFLGGLVTMFGGQGSMVRSVAGFQGTDGQPALRVAVNANAGPAVAAVAVDPAQPNVGATSPDVRVTLIKTANAA
jgi:hypothetical protein